MVMRDSQRAEQLHRGEHSERVQVELQTREISPHWHWLWRAERTVRVSIPHSAVSQSPRKKALL